MLVKGGKIPALHLAPSTFYARGSDCSGSHGDNNRTLSVSGISVTEFVFIQGSFLFNPDYSKATVASVSQFTFNRKVYDQFYIEIYYWM